MASGRAKKEKSDVEVVSVELPAPEGWIKKFTPKQGGTPRRNEVVFISPTGEEIRYRSQLDQYLRSHPGGPPSSSFDWGTGDTPRRSTRISEKVKISPEAEKPTRAAKSSEKLKTSEEKPKRAGRSSEKAKKSPESEKTAAGSSGSQKGTKRKKKIEDNEDESEEEAYVTDEDAPKAGGMEDAKGSKRGKKRKKNSEVGHKIEGHSADVVMEETEGTNPTKGSVEESMEPPVESQTANVQELADEAGKKAEKVEPTEVSLTAASDSEKATVIEKNGGAKAEDMEESEGMDHNKSKEGATDRTEEKIEENVEQPGETDDEIKYELAEKAKENSGMEESEGAEHSKAEGEASIEGVHGSLERETTDKTKESVQSAIELESHDRIEENVELVEQDLESLCGIEHELDETKGTDDIEEQAEGAEHKKSTEETIGEEPRSLLEAESTKKDTIEEEFAVVTQVTSVANMEKLIESQVDVGHEQADQQKVNELEQLDEMGKEFEPWQEAAKDHGASIGMEDAETLSANGGNKDKEASSAQNDALELAKGIEENPNINERLSFIEQQHVEVSTTKNGEASAVGIRETVMLSENGGKEEDVITGFDDFLHDFDDENTLLGSSPSNL